jgi:magnesium-transporting ATPase (P-type)
MFKIKTALMIFGMIAAFALALPTAITSAQVDDLQCGANSAASGSCHKKPSSPDLNETIARVINVISSLVAVASVIMIIVGGFRYVTSGGDSTKTGSARNTIMNAIIGLVIAVFAQVIVRFVLHSVK